MRCFNIADLFEVAADAYPTRLAVVAGADRLTYRQLDERATRFGRHLIDRGVGHGDHVAIVSWNRIEWLEAMIGTFKARAVPINVNYRYTADELAHVLSDAEAVAVVTEAAFAPVIAAIRGELPSLRHVMTIDDDTGDATTGDGAPTLADDTVSFEAALAAASSQRDFGARSGDDRYMLYTGGTTGAPKGVMWRSEDLFFAALAGGNPGGPPIDRPDDLPDAMVDKPEPWLVTSPLMHGNGQWNSLVPLLSGRGVVLWTGHHFDAAAVARLAADESVALLVLIGDGMALPFADHLESATVAPDLGALRLISSGGAILSTPVKARLAALLPDVIVIDAFGASETGSNGRLVGAGGGSSQPRFSMDDHTLVLDDELHPVPVGTVGRLARRGHVPLGYWNDPAKTAATFPTDSDGVRWAIPGDLARPEDDGTITLLGRGSACINTGGEKVYPDEVAIALKTHADLDDAIVVGAPDERFGQRVVAIIATDAEIPPTLDVLRDHLRPLLAGYKQPRQLVVTRSLRYTPQGKPDLKWAADLAATSLVSS